MDEVEVFRSTGLHSNHFFLIIFIRSGSGWHQIGPKRWTVEGGELFVIAPGELHDARGLSNADGFAVAFMADALTAADERDDPLALPGDPRWLPFLRQACVMGSGYCVPAGDRPFWSQLLRRLDDELTTQPLGYQRAARALLTLVLVETTRLAMPSVVAAAVPLDPVLADTFTLLDERYAEPLTLDQIARDVARSPRHLNRVARQATGHTVTQLLTRRRMVEARHLLLETNDSVELIGARVGYPDVGHFRRRFTAEHRMPPQVWRQLNR